MSRFATWAALFFVSAVVYSIANRLRQWLRLRHVPGPTIAGFSKIWVLNLCWRGTFFEGLGQVCKEYGPVVRIAPNYVVCGDPAEVRRLWHHRSGWDRSPWFKGLQLDPPNDSSLSMRDNERHTALRAKLAHGYSGKHVDGLHKHIDNHIGRLIQLIEEKYLSTEQDFRPVDLAHKIRYMTLDIISTLSFGEAFGFLETDSDLFGFFKTTEETLPLIQVIAMVPGLVSLLQSPLFKALMPSERDTVGLGKIMGFSNRAVASRFGPNRVERNDMLGSFVRNGLNECEAKSEALLQITAGSDTVAIALCNTIIHVTTNHSIYTRLQAEIDSAIQDGRVSSPVTDEEAKALPMLQACVKEGIRIMPPITGFLPRVSQKDDVICGVPIPAGTNVGWGPWACERNQDVFGPDADMYRPDRWLNASEKQVATMDHTVGLCFGQGRWTCLGKPIALTELHKMVVELFRRFELAPVDVTKPIENKVYGIVLQSMNMRVSRRPKPM